MIPSILCYVLLSVELLGLMTPAVFKPQTRDPQFSSQIDVAAVYNPSAQKQLQVVKFRFKILSIFRRAFSQFMHYCKF